MSKVAIKGADTGTATFTIEAPATNTNRTLTLPDEAGTLARTEEQIGVGQSWQDVLSSRTSGTTYTNSTGKPIQVNVSSGGTGLASSLTMVVSGVTMAISVAPAVTSQTIRAFVSGIVPNGATYSVTNSGGSITHWAELR